MAKFKEKQYPKSPKTSASPETKQNWLRRCEEIDKVNAEGLRRVALSKKLDEQIKRKKAGKSTARVSALPKRRKSTAKKSTRKPAKKAVKRKKK